MYASACSGCEVPGKRPANSRRPIATNFIRRQLEIHASRALIVYDPDTFRPVTRVVPNSLLAPVWLRFANAVSGSRTLRKCQACSKLFMVGNGREAKRIVCSEAGLQKRFRMC